MQRYTLEIDSRRESDFGNWCLYSDCMYEINELRDKVAALEATVKEKEEISYNRGLSDGESKRAILEVRGRDKFLNDTVNPQIREMRKKIAAFESTVKEKDAELSATRQWAALAIEWMEELRQDYIPGELTPDKVLGAIRKLRKQISERDKEIGRLRGALVKIAEGTEDDLPPFSCIGRHQMKIIAQDAIREVK